MLPRRAKIVLCACVAACAGVWWNVMYLQQSTRADILARTQRLGETSSRGPGLPLSIGSENAEPASHGGPEVLQSAQTEIDVDVVRAVQRELAHRGYQPGPADGLVHAVTRAAVMAYEHDHGLRLTGEPSEHLLKAILFGVPAGAGKDAGDPLPQAQSVIRSVQQSLAGLGYPVKKVDGRLGEETSRAIRAFESQNSLPPTGRISGALLLKLREVAIRQQRRASAH